MALSTPSARPLSHQLLAHVFEVRRALGRGVDEFRFAARCVPELEEAIDRIGQGGSQGERPEVLANTHIDAATEGEIGGLADDLHLGDMLKPVQPPTIVDIRNLACGESDTHQQKAASSQRRRGTLFQPLASGCER